MSVFLKISDYMASGGLRLSSLIGDEFFGRENKHLPNSLLLTEKARQQPGPFTSLSEACLGTSNQLSEVRHD